MDLVHRLNRPSSLATSSRSAIKSGSAWPDLVKKTGRGMILAGVAVVVPGVLVDNISLPVTIAMQVCYASLIGLGVILPFDEKKPEGRG